MSGDAEFDWQDNCMLDDSGYGQAAEAGDPEAQYELGRYCDEHGDHEQAVHWYSKAARQGSVAAVRRLVMHAERGAGTSPRR